MKNKENTNALTDNEITSEINKSKISTEKKSSNQNINDDDLDLIFFELEKESVNNAIILKDYNENFNNKYKKSDATIKNQQEVISNILNSDNNICNSNSKQIIQLNNNNIYSSNFVNNNNVKNEAIKSNYNLSFFLNYPLGNHKKNKKNNRMQRESITNKNTIINKIEFNNKNSQSISQNHNILPTSFAREKSYDFSTKNKQSLNKSFNSKFSKNVKGQDTMFFQLVSKQEVGIETTFFMTPQLIQIIKDFNGYFDRNLKIWFVSFFNYLKIHEALTKVFEKENITISLIDNLPLEFLSKIELKIFTFKPEGLKKQFTLDYTNEPKKSIYDIPPFMYTSLYNFQKTGIEFGISKNCRFLLADEMGVGKTIQAIGCTSVFQEDWPVLIICPSSLKYNWKDEIENWLKDIIKSRDMVQVIKTSSDDFKTGRKFYIISYDLSLRIEKKLQEMEFNFIIADEVHYLKSREAKRSKILLPLMQKSKRLILLSGTPIVARPSECFNLMKALRPDIFNKFLTFADRYCDPKNGPFGRDYTGSSNVKELNFILNSLMIRRLKKDVLSELPPKKRQKVTINTDEKVIKQIKILLNKSNVIVPDEVEGANIDSSNSTFSKAYTLTGQAKIEGIQEYMNYLIENDCKFLIFAHHKVVLDGIEEHVIKKKIDYMRIDGSVVNEKRHECVNKFQTNDNCKIAILAITACATGLTLTKASTVVFSEIYFTPAVMIQAEDRAHRIGQEHNCVNVHYLIGKDTVDEIIFPKLEDKFTVVSNALDAKKLNMDVQNVQKGGKGEIEIGKLSKNLYSKQNNIAISKNANNVIANENKTDNDKSANKTKITDFFSKKTSSVSNSNLSSSKLNLQKNSANGNNKNLNLNLNKSVNNNKHNTNNESGKAFENINEINRIEEDSFDDVLEGFLNDEALINQIFDNESNAGNVENDPNAAQDYFEGDNLAYFNLHKQSNGKRSREEMNNINNSISKRELKSVYYNINISNGENDYGRLSGNKEIKRK